MGELKDANNEDIVGCMGAKNIPGWTCCSKTKKTGGCKNVYFHKKCLELHEILNLEFPFQRDN